MQRRGVGGGFAAPNFRPGVFGGYSGFGGHPRLGAAVEKPSPAMIDQLDLPKDQGVVIGDVTPESAAAKAGLKTHDILLELGGKAVSNDPTEFRKQIAEIKANTPVDAVVLRKGKKETVKAINLPEAKADQPFPGFGAVEVNPGGVIELKALPPIPNVEFAPFAPGAQVSKMEVNVTDGQFNIHSVRDNLDITVTGTVDGDNK